MSKTYDPKCYELACWFLDECQNVTGKKRHELASRIQQTIHDYAEELMEEDQVAYEKYCEDKMEEWRIEGGPRPYVAPYKGRTI